MKKPLLLGLAIGLAFSSVAQNERHGKALKAKGELAKQSFKMERRDIMTIKAMEARMKNGVPAAAAKNGNGNPTPNMACVTENQIGSTWYDLGSNSSTRNLLAGKGSNLWATWTTDPSGGTWPNRGSGLAKSTNTGTSWQTNTGAAATNANNTRVETYRTGWPSIVAPNSTNPMMITHGVNPGGRIVLSKNTSGSTWDSTGSVAINSPFSGSNYWPRMVNKGDTVYAISITYPTAGSYKGQAGHLMFARSYNGGNTWATSPNGTAWWTLNGFSDSTVFTAVSGDAYNLAARGNTIALVAANSWGGIRYAKSSDAGQTWSFGWVDSLPKRLYDPGNGFPGQPGSGISDFDGNGSADTVLSNDEAVAVTIDNNNMIHVFYGQMRYLDDDATPTTTTWSYFPVTDGLAYWMEGMPANTPAMREQGINVVTGMIDYNNNGFLDFADNTGGVYRPYGEFGASLSSYPTCAYQASTNKVICMYSSLVEGSAYVDPNGDSIALRHTFAIVRDMNSGNWSVDPFDIACFDGTTPDQVTAEYMYPSALPWVIGNDMHVVYQYDAFPGQGVQAYTDQPLNTTQATDIMHQAVDISQIVIGIPTVNNLVSNVSVFPNPNSGKATVNVDLKESMSFSVKVYNAIGAVVYTKAVNGVAGANAVDFNANLNSGIYFVNIETANGVKTVKMIIE